MFASLKRAGSLGMAASTAIKGAIGGTASSLSGGGFTNGAYTAAFQHLFNELAGEFFERKFTEWAKKSTDQLTNIIGEKRLAKIRALAHKKGYSITGLEIEIDGAFGVGAEGSLMWLHDYKNGENALAVGYGGQLGLSTLGVGFAFLGTNAPDISSFISGLTTSWNLAGLLGYTYNDHGEYHSHEVGVGFSITSIAEFEHSLSFSGSKTLLTWL